VSFECLYEQLQRFFLQIAAIPFAYLGKDGGLMRFCSAQTGASPFGLAIEFIA